MTSESVLVPTVFCPRLTAPPGPEPVRPRLVLPAGARKGLDRVSGGRALEELVVLATATALVLGKAEHTAEPVITVFGPAGPTTLRVRLSTVASVADLVRSVDIALRNAGTARTEPDEPEPVLLVRSSRVGSGEPVPAGGAAGPVISLTMDGTGEERSVTAEADPRLAEAWFLRVVMRSVAAVLSGFTDPRSALADLSFAAPEDLRDPAPLSWCSDGPPPGAELVGRWEESTVRVVSSGGQPIPVGFVGQLQTEEAALPGPQASGSVWRRSGALAWRSPSGGFRYAGVDGTVLGEADGLETEIGQIFNEVLGGSASGLDEDFFDRGGHSLNALAVISTIEERMGVFIDLGRFLEVPTVRRIAELVRSETGERAGGSPAAGGPEEPRSGEASAAPPRALDGSEALLNLMNDSEESHG